MIWYVACRPYAYVYQSPPRTPGLDWNTTSRLPGSCQAFKASRHYSSRPDASNSRLSCQLVFNSLSAYRPYSPRRILAVPHSYPSIRRQTNNNVSSNRDIININSNDIYDSLMTKTKYSLPYDTHTHD